MAGGDLVGSVPHFFVGLQKAKSCLLRYTKGCEGFLFPVFGLSTLGMFVEPFVCSVPFFGVGERENHKDNN